MLCTGRSQLQLSGFSSVSSALSPACLGLHVLVGSWGLAFSVWMQDWLLACHMKAHPAGRKIAMSYRGYTLNPVSRPCVEAETGFQKVVGTLLGRVLS